MVELQSAEQIAAANHTVTWGFHNNEDKSLKPPCGKKFKQLYVGVQCLQGFALPGSACTFDMLSPPNYDDCRSYCPFELTVRAVPRTLRDGETVSSMLGPGEWQTFELDAGDYELVQLSLERREYDNSTYAHVSQDGLGGEMWLSRDACIQADVTPVEHPGYCPHGGVLTGNSSNGIDIQPHPLCSREANLSYAVAVDNASWVRQLRVAPGAGEVDDLGWGELQGEIAQWEATYAQEMHFPEQLRILATLNGLRQQAAGISFTNATWRRRWSLRTCLSSASATGLDAPPLGGRYFVTVYASHAMARRDVRDAHNGLYSLSLLQTSFERSPLLSGVQRQGCLRRGGAEVLSLSSTAAQPNLTSLGLAQVNSFLVSDASNHASELAVRRAAPPTATQHDLRVPWPDLRASQSACDVQAAQTWHMRVALAADAEAAEIFFEIDASLEDSVLQLGDSARGFACCGAYRYYAFPSLSEREAAMVCLDLTKAAALCVPGCNLMCLSCSPVVPRLQPCVTQAATLCDPGCNLMCPRLQPCVTQATALCAPGCSPMCPGRPVCRRCAST